MGCYIRYIVGSYRDNGKETGNYYIIIGYVTFKQIEHMGYMGIFSIILYHCRYHKCFVICVVVKIMVSFWVP